MSSGKRLPSGCGIFQIAFHHQIAPEHDLSHGDPITRYQGHGFGVAHRHLFKHSVVNALSGFDSGLLVCRQIIPLGFPGAHRRRTIDFCQTINMGYVKTHCRGPCQHRGWWCRSCGGHTQGRVKTDASRLRLCGNHIQDDWCTRHMSNSMGPYCLQNCRSLRGTQTDVFTRIGRERPGKTPAVAVKQRQGPKIHRVSRQCPLKPIAQRV